MRQTDRPILKGGFSVVIPARDEESNIGTCIEAIEASYHSYSQSGGIRELEIIVVDNGSKDKTATLVEQLGYCVLFSNGTNLSVVRNEGIRATKFEWVLTIDADSILSPNAFREIESVLQMDSVVGGGVMIWPERYSAGIVLTGLLVAIYFSFFRISMGCFYFKRSDFESIGGFDESRVSAEDIDFALRLKKLGRRTGRLFVNLFKVSITTSCRKFDYFGDWYFVFRPLLLWRLLRGRDTEAANKIWYKFEH